MGDMRFVLRLVGVALLATLIGALFVKTSRAQIPPRYWVITAGQLGTDSSDKAPDSVVLYWLDGNTAIWDSVKMTPAIFKGTDSLIWYTQLASSIQGWNKIYNPAAVAIWYWGSERSRDNALSVFPYNVGYVDSLDQSISVSISEEDAAEIADSTDAQLSSTHGAGAWGTGAAGSGAYVDSVWVATSSDTTAIGSGIQVWLRPNGGGSILKASTDANSWATFSADADTYLVSIWVVGYYQTVIPDTNEVASQDTKDTVYMTATTAGSPSVPGLTGVAFNFFYGDGDSIQEAILYYKLESSSPTNFTADSIRFVDPSFVFEKRTDASGQVIAWVIPNDSIFTEGYQTGRTQWKFWAVSPLSGEQLLGKDGIKIVVPASPSVLTYPKDW